MDKTQAIREDTKEVDLEDIEHHTLTNLFSDVL